MRKSFTCYLYLFGFWRNKSLDICLKNKFSLILKAFTLVYISCTNRLYARVVSVSLKI